MIEISSEAEYSRAVDTLRKLVRSPPDSREDEEGARLLTLIEKWETAKHGESLKRVFSRDGNSFVTTIPLRPLE